MSQTIELPRTDGPGTGHDSNWRVIVRNDDHNTFEHVAHTLSKCIPGISIADGFAYADKIHKHGQTIVWTGHKELAEHYWEILAAAGLTMAPLEQG